MSHNPLVGLILFIVMAIFTLWFSSLMLRVVDILYKPSVKKWMKKNTRQKKVTLSNFVCKNVGIVQQSMLISDGRPDGHPEMY